jgi:hypothetical protein
VVLVVVLCKVEALLLSRGEQVADPVAVYTAGGSFTGVHE